MLCLLNPGEWEVCFVLTCFGCKWRITAQNLHGRNAFSFLSKEMTKERLLDTRSKKKRRHSLLLGKIQEKDTEIRINDFSGDHPAHPNSSSPPTPVPFPFPIHHNQDFAFFIILALKIRHLLRSSILSSFLAPLWHVSHLSVSLNSFFIPDVGRQAL